MTSLKRIEANRRNALNSTGPRTLNGKQASRRNALRHGFTAETVIEPLENLDEYRTFEGAIFTDYLPQTPVEQELVRRLASLFWRLRRATSIETGLLRIQSEIILAFRSSRQKRVHPRAEGDSSPTAEMYSEGSQKVLACNAQGCAGDAQDAASRSRDVALSYLRLTNLDNELVDRLSRYEGSLWRQAVQTLFALQALKRR
jgi:hypothetical protein